MNDYSYMEKYSVVDLIEDLKDAAADINYDAGRMEPWRFVNRILKIRVKLEELQELLDQLDAREEEEE